MTSFQVGCCWNTHPSSPSCRTSSLPTAAEQANLLWSETRLQMPRLDAAAAAADLLCVLCHRGRGTCAGRLHTPKSASAPSQPGNCQTGCITDTQHQARSLGLTGKELQKPCSLVSLPG